MKHWSINLKFAFVIILNVILLGSAAYYLLDNVYRLQVRNQANTVADNVASFGGWVAKYGRVWVKTEGENSFLGTQSVVNSEKLLEANISELGDHEYTFYSKNPALAQREFSEVVANSDSPAKFRLTSDNFMNPLNEPDEFELEALSQIKLNDAPFYERFDAEAGEYRFARTVKHKASCIKCHGDPADAPADVISRYGNERGFGFKEGDVAGVISVTLPTVPFIDAIIPFIGWKEISLLLLTFIIGILFLHRVILAPIKKLSVVAEKATQGYTDDIDIGNVRQNTNDEVEKLALSIKRLYTSTKLALYKMEKTQGNDY